MAYGYVLLGKVFGEVTVDHYGFVGGGCEQQWTAATVASVYLTVGKIVRSELAFVVLASRSLSRPHLLPLQHPSICGLLDSSATQRLIIADPSSDLPPKKHYRMVERDRERWPTPTRPLSSVPARRRTLYRLTTKLAGGTSPRRPVLPQQGSLSAN